jgi:DNA repair protein RecO (recombination protein O)
MQWSDEGIIIGTRRHGETSVIIELMTPSRGRHLGLVRGGRSRRQQPILQPGNSVSATWRARLDEHLGTYTVEPLTQRAARLIESAAGLYGIQTLGELLRLLPEREAHPQLYDGLATILDWFEKPLVAGALMARFELGLLDDLGFGLDLERCAATGTNDDLAFVSPKTGRAVSRSAGEPYGDKLIKLPRFLTEPASAEPATAEELAAAFRLTGYFLARHVFEPRGMEPPEARQRFIALIAKTGAVLESQGAAG